MSNDRKPLDLEGLKREVEAQIVAELKSWRDDPEYEVLARIAKLVELLLSTRNYAQGEADAWRARALTAEAALQSATAELTRTREADGWQPIETAPKDGEPVLLYAAPNAEWDFAGLTDWCYWDEGSWIILSECEHDCFRASGLYTHWLRPMPPGCRPAALQPQEGGE